MQVFWDIWIQWSHCPYFVAKRDLHWIYLVEKGKSGYSCQQDAKFCSTPNYQYLLLISLLNCKRSQSDLFFVTIYGMHCDRALAPWFSLRPKAVCSVFQQFPVCHLVPCFANKYFQFSNSNAIGKLTLIKFRNQFKCNLESNLNLVQK